MIKVWRYLKLQQCTACLLWPSDLIIFLWDRSLTRETTSTIDACLTYQIKRLKMFYFMSYRIHLVSKPAHWLETYHTARHFNNASTANYHPCPLFLLRRTDNAPLFWQPKFHKLFLGLAQDVCHSSCYCSWQAGHVLTYAPIQSTCLYLCHFRCSAQAWTSQSTRLMAAWLLPVCPSSSCKLFLARYAALHHLHQNLLTASSRSARG